MTYILQHIIAWNSIIFIIFNIVWDKDAECIIRYVGQTIILKVSLSLSFHIPFVYVYTYLVVCDIVRFAGLVEKHLLLNVFQLSYRLNESTCCQCLITIVLCWWSQRLCGCAMWPPSFFMNSVTWLSHIRMYIMVVFINLYLGDMGKSDRLWIWPEGLLSNFDYILWTFWLPWTKWSEPQP